MKKSLCLLLPMQLLLVVAFAQTSVQHLLTENKPDPVGVDATVPRFSWQLVSNKRNTVQAAYAIQVFASGNKKLPVWNSGKVNTAQSVFIPYAGQVLQSGKKYKWIVQVWDNNGTVAAKSDTASFQMGLLDMSDWKAKWIEPGYVEDSVMRPSPMFRKQFSANKKIVSATAYITSHGLYEAQINGKRVGDDYFTPGWTAYKKRLQYQEYDVTSLLAKGNNAIGVHWEMAGTVG